MLKNIQPANTVSRENRQFEQTNYQYGNWICNFKKPTSNNSPRPDDFKGKFHQTYK